MTSTAPSVPDRLRRSGVRGALVNSRPNEGSMTLAQAHAAALAAGVQVVPFVRPYRDHADYRHWLGALPPGVARQIGWDNGAALFGLRA